MKKGILTIILMISMFLSISCANQPNKKSSNIDRREKAPQTLTKVMDGIDKLLTSVDDIAKTTELTEMEFQAQKLEKEGNGKPSDGNKQGNPQSNQDGNQAKNQKKDGEQKGNITRDEEIFMKWRGIDKNLEEIHKDWNSYEVEGVKKGANPDQGKEFKKSLNSFTKAIENRQMTDIMDTGSRSINSLAPFFDLYKDEINGDLSRINYSTYQAFLKAKEGDIKTADKLINEAAEYSGRIRQKLDKDKDKDKIKELDKLSLAISDMKLALNENSIKLLEIKRDITLKNIKALRE
ncbi:exported hypothetical protein [[Clostridium] ultunense Esp]|uniref:Lipoprotein n=1 Tax=[Clostridium] ultunense Esp TaxID=1288971 RepID=M1Z1R0_9FIRM|nr:hypothetical protein [Schnuerera ultunensis]CCQ96770.1 exported hypothetical protein [[Clostridium] ultunense Esp]SHD75534.1 conserved exported protein of unknown function [[Clostridium] ultunense Esp]